MTREEFAIALGCTPETAPGVWDFSDECCSERMVLRYDPDYDVHRCAICGAEYDYESRSRICTMPDPFNPATPKDLHNLWLPWTVPFLKKQGDVFFDDPDRDEHCTVYYGQHEVIHGAGTSPGAASIAACVAVMEQAP